MKKIVSVLLVTALVCGSLFAQVKLNYRTQASIVTYEKDKGRDGNLSFFDLEIRICQRHFGNQPGRGSRRCRGRI